MRHITSRESALAVLWAIIIMALTALPYESARRAAPPGLQFSGFIWGVDDGNVYLSWLRQASEGHFLLGNQYTTKDQSPHFLNLFLVALGRLCALTGLSPLAVFQGARYFCGVFCLVAFFALARGVLPSRAAAWWALALASVSSGLGWLVVLLGKGGVLAPGWAAYPMDVADGWQAQPEAIVFSSLLLNPLFAFSLGLVSLTALAASRLTGPRAWPATIAAGLLLLLLGNVHGYDIFPLHALILTWLLVSCLTGRLPWSRAAAQYALILLLSAASPLWAAYGASADPAYTAKVRTPTLSPRPADVALGYGLVLALAAVGAWLATGPSGRPRRRFVFLTAAAIAAVGIALQQLQAPAMTLGLLAWLAPLLALALVIPWRGSQRDWTALLPLLWAACGAAALYLPVPFQRKLMEGLHLPLCLLGGVALAAIASGNLALRGLTLPTWRFLAAAGLLVTLPSNLLLISESMRHVRANNRTLLHVLAPPVYLSSGELAAMQWLGDHTSSHDVVLSSSLTGNHIPAHAPCRVVVGHWAETLDFTAYMGLAATFYEPGRSVAEREAVLAAFPVTLVWWGPQEVLLQTSGADGLATDPCASLPSLRRVYNREGVRIYALPGWQETRHE